MKSKKFSAFVSVLILMLTIMAAPANAAAKSFSSSQKKSVTALFKALASSNTDKIAIAQKKYVAKGSAAYRFVDLVRNHHSATKYFKSITVYGLPSGIAPIPDTAGKYKVTSTSATLDSSVNEFDSFNTKFTFDKKGKITGWTAADLSRNNPITLKNRINTITSTFEGSGFKVDAGYLYKQTDGKAFLQLQIKNISTSLKSWSYAGGQYGGPDAKYLVASSNPTGCLFPGQTAFIEAQINGYPQVAKGTAAVFDAPTFNGCGPGSTPASASLRFTTN
jgi:hypothetical protein